MKRAALGGATRGPVAPTRQRRTLRAVQIASLIAALALAWLAVRSFGDGEAVQGAALLVLTSCAGAGAYALQGPGGSVRLPTPARLEELAGRAEAVAIGKVESEATAPGSEGPRGG